tara:strand:+ start:172 stop:309 length:138 start_codon:yes stop_codon:yes gene_type:complete
MITQNDMNKVLVDINKVLEGLNARITELENQQKAKAPVKKTTSSS